MSAPVAGARSEFFRTTRRQVALANEGRRCIQLRGLPRTALPSDIQRMLSRSNVAAVSDIYLNYHRFRPTGDAYLALTSSDYLNSNINALANARLSSIPISVASSDTPHNIPRRTRGTQGLQEAATRGILTGNGARGGLSNEGQNVVIWGLPGKMTSDGLKSFLHNFRLAGSEGGKKEIVKVDLPQNSVHSRISKHLIRMSSVSEAHRMVRALHMTYYEPEQWQQNYQIRARVIY